jgi:hypothetical protein
MTPGNTVYITPTVSELGGDTVTLWATNLPGTATYPTTNALAPFGQVFAWTPTDNDVGTHNIEFLAADDDGTDTVSFVVYVEPSHNIWFNEIHYDNAGPGGIDVDEGWEICGLAGVSLANYTVEKYDNGLTYGNEAMTGTIDDEGTGYGAVWTTALSGIRNTTEGGDIGGLALLYASGGNTTVVDFVSWSDIGLTMRPISCPRHGGRRIPSQRLGKHHAVSRFRQ